MRVPRSAVIYVVSWVGVVLACSVLAWAVISRAGEGVVTSEDLPERSPSTSTPRIIAPAPTLSPNSAPSTSPSSPGSSATDPSTTSTTTTPSTSAPVQRTWAGRGGVVVVECRGATAGLVSARPDSGFAVEVDDTGPGRVEVEFEDDDARTRVRAECVSGEPVFDVDSG